MAILQELMTEGIEHCEATDNLTALAEKMKKEDVGFLPITDNDKYAGVVTDRDIVVRGLANGSAENTKAKEVMSVDVVTGNPKMNVEEAAQLMQDHQIKRLLVIEGGAIKGVVSVGDLGVKDTEINTGKTVSAMSKGQANN